MTISISKDVQAIMGRRWVLAAENVIEGGRAMLASLPEKPNNES